MKQQNSYKRLINYPLKVLKKRMWLSPKHQVTNANQISLVGAFYHHRSKEKWTNLKSKDLRIRLLRQSLIFSWFWSDMMKTHLIWIKFIFFFQSGSLVVLYPYLVIHMRSLGLNVEEVALVNGVIPVADIIGPPLAGFVADKIGNFR